MNRDSPKIKTKMTVKEAIVKSLDELKVVANSIELCDYILQNKYADFTGKTPAATVSAQLGDFIRKGDKRVKRIKQAGGNYGYYLTKFEQYLNIDSLPDIVTSVSNSHKTERRLLRKEICINY